MHSGNDACYATRRQLLDPRFTSKTSSSSSSFQLTPKIYTRLFLGEPSRYSSRLDILPYLYTVSEFRQEISIELYVNPALSIRSRETRLFSLSLSSLFSYHSNVVLYQTLSFFLSLFFFFCDFSLGNFRFPANIRDTPANVQADSLSPNSEKNVKYFSPECNKRGFSLLLEIFLFFSQVSFAECILNFTTTFWRKIYYYSIAMINYKANKK